MSLTTRFATVDDAITIAEIHVNGWQGAYGGLIDQDYIDSQTIEKRSQDWQEWLKDDTSERLIAFKEDKLVGFIAYGSLRTAPPGTSKIRPLYSAEIYALYLLPDYFRQGVGTFLLKQAIHNLSQNKHQSMCLWVLDGNKRAKAFYEQMGGQRVGKKMVTFGTTNAKEICYGWRDIKEIINK